MGLKSSVLVGAVSLSAGDKYHQCVVAFNKGGDSKWGRGIESGFELMIGWEGAFCIAPPTVGGVLLSIVSGKVCTMDYLSRGGLTPESFLELCSLCNEEEMEDHLFLYYEFSSIWRSFRCFLESMTRMVKAWEMIPLFGCGSILWWLIPDTISQLVGMREMGEFSGWSQPSWRIFYLLSVVENS